MTDLLPGRLAEIAGRCAAATSAPWQWTNYGLEHESLEDGALLRRMVLALPHPHLTQARGADLEFIGNAPADISYLLTLVTQLEQDLTRAEQRLSEVTEAAVQPLRQAADRIDIQPVLDRAAKLEAALEVVAVREALNRAELDRRPAADHVMCARETVRLRAERDQLADELERARDAHRRQQASHDAIRARWQSQLDELTIERDAASRERREAELEAARLREENAQLEAARGEAAVAQSEYHARMRQQVNDAHERAAKLQAEVHVLTSSEALQSVAAHAVLREVAGVLSRSARQEWGHAQRRDLLAMIATVLSDSPTEPQPVDDDPVQP